MSQLGPALGLLVFVGLIAAIVYFLVNAVGKDSSEKERARFRKELAVKIKEEDKIKELEDKIKRERKEDKIKEEKKRAPKKESFARTTFSGGGLTSKIARLQKLYKNGTLTKAEFEQAKNKLLKWKSLIKFGVGLVRDE